MITIAQIINENIIIQILLATRAEVKIQPQPQNKNQSISQMQTQLLLGIREKATQKQKQRLMEKYKDQHPETTLLIYLNNSNDEKKDIRKFIAKTNIVGRDALFQDWNDLKKFFQGKGNYLWRHQWKIMQLFLSTVAVDYGRNRKIEIKFQEIQLSQKQMIETQNKMLRKQLQFYKNQSIRLEQICKQNPYESYQVNKIKNHQFIKYQQKQTQKLGQVIINQILHQDQLKMNSQKYFRQNESNQATLGKLPILLGDRIKLIEKQIQKAEKQQRDYVGSQEKVNLEQDSSKSHDGYQKKERKPKNKIKKTKKIKPLNVRKSLKSIKSQKNKTRVRANVSSGKKSLNQMCQQNNQSLGQSIQKKRIQTQWNKFNITYINGNTYEGSLKQNKFNGKGRFTCKLFTFDGIWKNGKPFGYGTTYYPSGAVQKGFYKNGYFRYGQGEDVYENGQSYVGNFKKQMKNGFGTYYFKDGQYYQGQWRNNLQHGKGIQCFANGDRYVGTWVDDQKHGEGQNITKNGKSKQIWDKGTLIQQIVVVSSEQE